MLAVIIIVGDSGGGKNAIAVVDDTAGECIYLGPDADSGADDVQDPDPEPQADSGSDGSDGDVAADGSDEIDSCESIDGYFWSDGGA